MIMRTFLLTLLVLLGSAIPSLCSIDPPSDLGRPGERNAGNLTIDQAIRSTIDPNMPSMFTAADGLILAELDMKLTADQYEWLYGGDRQKRDRAVYSPTLNETLRWPNGALKYIFRNEHFSMNEMYMIRRAMTDWERYTCINMDPKEKHDKNYVPLQNGYGCNSQLGMVGGAQPLNLEYPGCRYKGLYLHELGHAIGLVHEHQLPDRDNYIDIIWGNVQEDLKVWFKKYSRKDVDQLGVPYEYSSIMHYGITAFSIGGNRQTIKAKYPDREEEIGKVYLKELAYTDVELVNKMYRCADHCPDKTKCGAGGHLDQNCNCICKDGSQDCDKTKTPVPKSCRNNYKSWACYVWANQGECERNPGFMKAQCAKACGQCGPKPTLPSPCKNQYVDKKCDKWAKRGDCLTNTDWMTSHCPVSCNLCTPGANKKKENCKDTFTEEGKCTEWVRSGECIINPVGMFLNCQQSCMECDKTEEEMQANGFDLYKDIEDPIIIDDNGECVNKNDQCESWASQGECTKNPTWMIPNCRKACDKCSASDGKCKNVYDDTKCTNWARAGECRNNVIWMSNNCAKACGTGKCLGQTTPPPNLPKTTEGACIDTNDQCQSWAAAGECLRNPGWMIPNCRLACGKCKAGQATPRPQPRTTQGPIVCENDHKPDSECEAWAKVGHCQKNPGYMLIHCKKACGVCRTDSSTDVITPKPDSPSDCKDSHTECASWASSGYCDNNPTVLSECRKSCNNCHSGCTDDNAGCPGWAVGFGCQQNPSYMLRHCQKSCKVC